MCPTSTNKLIWEKITLKDLLIVYYFQIIRLAHSFLMFKIVPLKNELGFQPQGSKKISLKIGVDQRGILWVGGWE
jgi:hypothetical protein